jgi:putative PIG3 family NAD(P)H quinone oxidoreductase
MGRVRAIEITRPGGPEVLKWNEVDDPSCSDGDVVIDVVAAGVNRADVAQRMGRYAPPPGASPLPGLEVSGRISSRGADAGEWQVGDEVCALLAGGGYAERVAAPASQLLPIPRGVDLPDAAGLPEVAATVWSNVFMVGALGEGDTLLIHGGASGIGTMAIQLAKARGARVVCTVGGPEKAAACRDLGADVVVEYHNQDFTDHGPFDVILDIIGAMYLDRNVHSLSVGGRLIVIGLQGGAKAELDLAHLMMRRASVIGTTLRGRPPGEKAAIVAEVREHVWPLVEAGQVRPVIDRRVPMAEAAEAHRVMERSDHTGKILLTT